MWRTDFAVSIAILVGAAGASAQPAKLDQRIGGVLVGDLSLDAVYLTRDMNGDGDADDPGEATVYYDGSNASGAPAPNSAFTIFQARDRAVYVGDGSADAVLRLVDLNGDRDAQDAGEASIWFSADGNAGGLDLATPNGVWQADDGAVYIVTAGTSTTVDAIYRTVDLNDDGDAEDAGEATVWLDTQTLVPDSSAFELVFIGAAAYFTDPQGGAPDAVIRAEDSSGDGTIQADELGVFVDETSVGIGTSLVTDGTSLYVIDSAAGALRSLTRLTDLDGSGAIDQPNETEEVWNESLVPAGLELGSSFGAGIGPGGEVMIGSAGADIRDNMFRLIDMNGDGDFLDAGETIAWATGNGSGVFTDNPRSMEYALTRLGDANGDDVVDVSALLEILASWGPCPGCPGDFDDNGIVDVDDLLVVLANWS
jgi:hypothetical protein